MESTDFVGASESFTPSFDAGDLDVGPNSISGNIFESDVDTVLVTLPAGLVVDSIGLIVSNHVDSGVSPTDLSVLLLTPDGGSPLSIPGDGTLNLSASPISTPGDFTLNVSHTGGTPDSSSDWEWQITVVVPEPTSLALLGLGGVIMLARQRRLSCSH